VAARAPGERLVVSVGQVRQPVQVLGGQQLESSPSLAAGRVDVVHAALLRGWLGCGTGGLLCRLNPPSRVTFCRCVHDQGD
jgi:hypothetical protein